MALVVSNRHYDVYLSSTAPNGLRFRIINADSNFKIRLSMTYSAPNNINLYKGDVYVDPTNANRTKGYLILNDPAANSDIYMPKITSPGGTNYFKRDEKKLYFSIDGTTYIDLRIAPEIFVNYGIKATTSNAFFNSANLVSNVANLLNIPADKIRRVEIVSETSSSRIVKRSNSVVYLRVVISTDPVPSNADQASYQAKLDEILKYGSSIVTDYQLNTTSNRAQQLFNIQIVSLDVTQTPQDPTQNATFSVDVPVKLAIKQNPSSCRLQSPCDKSAVVVALNANVSFINAKK